MKNVIAKPWKSSSPPKKILVIRFQALGDTVITLPYLQSLKQQTPQVVLHFLTRKEVSLVPKSIVLFDRILTIGGGRNARVQFALSLIKIPLLWFQRYDVVIDLQNHRISRIIRKLLATDAWTEFDRASPISAGERTKRTIEALWAWKITLQTKFIVKQEMHLSKLLIENGWRIDTNLIVLNPSGFSPSRNWPIENYVSFAKLWLSKIDSKTQFVLLLLPSHRKKADSIKMSLGDSCIDLTGRANQIEAFAILQKCELLLTEDSGLMHMAWVQGVPTLALFSSSRKDWSAPQGEWSGCLDSSDLECGPCGLEICKYGDNRCLNRYTPDQVLLSAQSLLNKNSPV